VGVFWKKASPASARLTLWIGSLLGGLIFALDKLYPETFLGRTPFLMMAFYLFCVCVLMQVTFSYLYPAAAIQTGDRLYWRSLREPLESKGWRGIGNYKILSLILLLIMILLFYVFR
jgi:SSS family solute:Na+ symporter